jgi:glycosyltransferase involved in cell wall biosynthesis
MQAQTVHVLMPVFNTENYLEKSLESVFDQTYEDLRLIAYNDGSTDGSLPILERYAARFRDKFVLLQSSVNRGETNARKTLLNYCEGLDKDAMILWLDSDDCFIEREFIEKFARQMEKTGAEICLFNLDIAFESEDQIGNADGLLKEMKAAEKILDAIRTFPNETVSAALLPDILNFTSLGGTKGYRRIPMPQAADCPYHDFVYMAALLNASKITAFPSDYKPIRYLRRAQSSTGRRTAAAFDAVLTQLERFIDAVDPVKKQEHPDAIEAFVLRKIDQYEILLQKLISEGKHDDLTEQTREKYRERASRLPALLSSESRPPV